MTYLRSLSGRAAAALFTAATTFAMLPAQNVAWAWVNTQGQGASFTPPANYQHTPSGASITVDRDPAFTNVFRVRFPGVATHLGNFQVTPYGGDHAATVIGWGSGNNETSVQVALFDAAGADLSDGAFTVLYREGGDLATRQAYLWANDPSAPTYTPNTSYSWNGNRAAPSITRLAAGHYRVTLPGLATALFGDGGHVQVTPQSALYRRAKVESWAANGADLRVFVRCLDASGALADSRFFLHYNETAAPIAALDGSGAHVWADRATTAHYSPSAPFRDSNGREGPANAERIDRLDVGRYRVSLPDVAPLQSTTAQVTAYGSDAAYAAIDSWVSDGCGGTRVNVRTYSGNGTPTDARFTLLYLTDRPAASQQVAWALVAPSGQTGTFTPGITTQFSTSGQTITVTRDPAQQNRFIVNFNGLEALGACVLASAFGGNHCAVVNNWLTAGNDTRAAIELFDPAGNPANDARFLVFYRRAGNYGDREAYLWANQESTQNYTPDPSYSWNADRADPTIFSPSIGYYEVTLPGLATTGRPEQGHVQVTPYANDGVRAQVESWTSIGADLRIKVRCYTTSGALTDSKFVLHYNEEAAPIGEEVGAGAHVWAGSPTLASYTPNAFYTDSNGAYGPHGAELVERVGVGHYRVTLPDLGTDQWHTAQVTAYGSLPRYASIDWMQLSAFGARVEVKTYDPSGAPLDSAFCLLALTPQRALGGSPATNLSFGNGCHGPVLTARTRPILCTDWELDLTVLPANAFLGFLQLDHTNPNQPIGSGAPGCTTYTGGAVTLLLFPPVPVPAYYLTIPGNTALVGVPIFAQGGAFAPGLNPFSLATSNGVLAVVGDH
ncbi:MAG: hypothetical protein KDE27_00215 [Planctomycetes bacterium]|nr:hypothetical protein [Planctomycetota bacterium]